MSKSQYLLTSLQKSLKVLDVLSQADEMTLTEIKEKTGFDNTSIYRMLYTLELENYIEKTPKSTYHLGTKFISYGEKLKSRFSIATLIKDDMADLAKNLGQTIYLGTLTNTGKVAFIHREDSPSGVQVSVPAGHSTKAFNSALGKIQLAFMSDQERLEYLEKFQNILSDEQILALHGELNQAKALGYTIDCDEHFKGFGSFAVPILDDKGACQGALGIVAVASQIKLLIDAYLPQMTAAAHAMTSKISSKP
ncbi:IclR family transcriptional regulator [Streptococcus caprae]|uniref:IclR family transcriptional regulator n=1 Tax=Streptococcus caprae TaxID=1640501 RepID=A0ABV8CTA1_9STRE